MQREANAPFAEAKSRIRRPGAAYPTRLPGCAYAHSRACMAGMPTNGERDLLNEAAVRLDTAAVAVDALAESERSRPLDPEAIGAADSSCRSLVQVAERFLRCGVLRSGMEVDPVEIVVPERNRAFKVARTTACLPAYLPPPFKLNLRSVRNSGEDGTQQVCSDPREHSGAAITSSTLPAALHMALTTVAASVTTALAAFPGPGHFDSLAQCDQAIRDGATRA